MKDNLELERKDIRIDPEVQVDDDDLKQINFMIDAFFEVDKKFGIHINDEDDAWLNIWCSYNPFEDELAIQCQISRGTENDEWFDYEPTKEESKLIKDMLAEHIEKRYKQTPEEFCQSVWETDETQGPNRGGM